MLGRTLALLLTFNLVIMLALPLGIFADTIVGGGISAEYDNEQEPGEESGQEGGQEQAPPSSQDPPSPANGAGQGNNATQNNPPNAIGPLAADEATVTSWAELISAMSNTSIKRIYLSNNISRGTSGNNLPAITRDLEIDGQGYTLDLTASSATEHNGFSLGNTSNTARTFVLKNIYINRQKEGAKPLIGYGGSAEGAARSSTSQASSYWTINISDFSSATMQSAGILAASDAVVNLSGSVI
ncbi:MAG: hypothetical protein LBH56_04910, partial [Coriobacteriales bacterium]|nr:hypothetical protein [Coriobacteriales bacterium]